MMVKKFGVFRKTQVFVTDFFNGDGAQFTNNELLGYVDELNEAERVIDADIERLVQESPSPVYQYCDELYSLDKKEDRTRFKSDAYFAAEIYVWSPG